MNILLLFFFPIAAFSNVFCTPMQQIEQFLFDYWYIIVPVLAIILFLVIRRRMKIKEEEN